VVVTVLRGATARVHADLQLDFSLHDPLSLYLVEAVAALDPETPDYPLEVLSLVEAILESPQAILRAQVEVAKRELLARLKAEGVPYEDRIARLEEVSHPRPEAEFIRASFATFAQAHPWVREEDVRPKSIAREIYEGHQTFQDYVSVYGLARSEGVLLRYLSQVHNTLAKSVPAAARSDAVMDVIAFFRTLLARVDTSLLEAWEGLFGEAPESAAPAAAAPLDLATSPRLLGARLRSELHGLVHALSERDFESAVDFVRADADDPWTAERFAAALEPYFAEYERIRFDAEARRSHRTTLQPLSARRWRVAQTLLDPEGDGLWAIEGEVDLTRERDPQEPLLRLRRIGT